MSSGLALGVAGEALVGFRLPKGYRSCAIAMFVVPFALQDVFFLAKPALGICFRTFVLRTFLTICRNLFLGGRGR